MAKARKYLKCKGEYYPETPSKTKRCLRCDSEYDPSSLSKSQVNANLSMFCYSCYIGA